MVSASIFSVVVARKDECMSGESFEKGAKVIQKYLNMNVTLNVVNNNDNISHYLTADTEPYRFGFFSPTQWYRVRAMYTNCKNDVRSRFTIDMPCPGTIRIRTTLDGQKTGFFRLGG